MEPMYFIYTQYFKYPLQITSEHSADYKVKQAFYLNFSLISIDCWINSFKMADGILRYFGERLELTHWGIYASVI